MNTNIDYTVEAKDSVEETVELLIKTLNSRGFGVLSRIDVHKIIKQKLGEDIEPYVILDVCNPRQAKEALTAHKEVGLIVPCKMTVFEDHGKVLVSLYKPREMIKVLGFQDLQPLAEHAEKELRLAMDSIVA
ncbi:MAG: DUF302 domain-containing protein [Nitrososphaerota archaeon]|nr:DUF302 domain-containing protein [Nitrososphaerota archaeon]MDG6923177.1 DUF302 domain-containing protein [Nitrososphaerota archaeon]